MDDPTTFDDAGDDVLDIGSGTARRPVRVAVAVGAIAAVVAVAIFVVHRSSGPHRPATAVAVVDPTPVPYGSVPPSVAASNAAATSAFLNGLLATVPALPGATASRHAPLPALSQFDDVLEGEDDGTVQARSAWWTAPGTVAAALAFYATRVTAPVWEPIAAGSDGVGAVRSDGVTVHEVSFEAGDTAYATEVELEIVVAPAGQGVAIGVDVQAQPLPQRTAVETILAPTSVTVTIERQAGPTLHRTFGAGVAARLAQVANGLPVFPAGAFSCPAELPSTQDELQFTTGAGPITLDAGPTGCPSVAVTAAGQAQPALSGGDTLDASVLTAFGLPANYGLTGY